MKQRISIEQLQELTGEQQQRLRELWEPQCYDAYYDSVFDVYNVVINDAFGNVSEYVMQNKNRLLPLLNIGQMIELLTLSKAKHVILHEKYNELCDALWSAVKEVL
jgi:hypothetical protein